MNTATSYFKKWIQIEKTWEIQNFHNLLANKILLTNNNN